MAALRYLEYGERQARWAVGEALTHVGRPVEFDPLLRAALAVLREARDRGRAAGGG